jgi:hypothetical protein
MRSDVQRDFDWGRQYIGGIKRVLSNYTFDEAPEEFDTGEATDLMILKARDIRIACRMRKPAYLVKYGNEFTIRTGRPTGTKTELAKILEGFGDRFFYGFAHPTGVAIARWCLLDLDMFRRDYDDLSCFAARRRNGDGTTFLAFDLQYCANMLIAASWLVGPDTWVVRWEGQRELRL